MILILDVTDDIKYIYLSCHQSNSVYNIPTAAAAKLLQHHHHHHLAAEAASRLHGVGNIDRSEVAADHDHRTSI